MKRRDLLVSAGMVGLAMPLHSLGVELLAEIAGDREVNETGIVIDMPRIAETGNSVPVTVTVDSPMTETDHVRQLHILVPGNPEKKAATYRFTPMSGKAEISTRIRLARTQTVRAIAEMSDDSVRVAKLNVLVTVGACIEEIWSD